MDKQDSQFLDSQWVRERKEASDQRRRDVVSWALFFFVVLIAVALVVAA